MNALHRIIVCDSATLMPKLAVSQRIFVCVQVATPRCKIADADANARSCSVRHTDPHDKYSRFTHPGVARTLFLLVPLYFVSLLAAGGGENVLPCLSDLPYLLMQDISNAGKEILLPHTSKCLQARAPFRRGAFIRISVFHVSCRTERLYVSPFSCKPLSNRYS